MRQYQTALYEGKPLPDCVEITGSNFLDIISRIKREALEEKEAENDSASLEFLNMLHSYRFIDEDQDQEESQGSSSESEGMAQGYVFTLEHLLPSKHPLNLYYSWLNENREFQFSQERRNRFAALCQRIPHIRYLKSTHGKGGEKDYELAPGFINFLNLMRHFFQDQSHKEFLPYNENIEVFTKELQRFCES